MGNNVRLVLAALCCCLARLGSAQTIQKMTVRGDIRFRFATTEMICVMSNDEDKAKELVFDVTLPKDAFIANFSMEIEGKEYPGNVRKKQEARQEYLAARNTGYSGALVEQSARHSNKFDVSVNIAAQSNVTFTLIYQELLRRRFGSYEYSVYIDGERLDQVLDFSMEIYIQDRNEIKDVRTPAMRKEVINNVVEEGQNTLTQITNPSATTVYVVYQPSREELKEMGGGWFVVQYDVLSNSAGDLLVVDGYFVHFFMPPDDLPPLPLDMVFVLDISGSMAGRKMEQLKVAMSTILDDLREKDRFNILLFDGSVQVWESSLQEASESNVRRAQDYVKTINYRGSTNLHLALMRGLELLQGSREAERMPMIFFLTDGEPTAGEQDPAKIMANVSSRNEGVVSIYSLAFGAGADYKMLRQVSAQNNGFARKIYEASDAAQQVLGLYKEISTVVIHGLTISYHSTSNNDDGDDDDSLITIDNSTITICDLTLVSGHSDFVVAGKLENAEALIASPEKAGGLRVAVSGLGASEKINLILEENDLSKLTLEGDNPFWSVPRDLSKMAERAWAFLLLKQLLKEKVVAAENEDLVKELDERILELSLKYHFVTPLTSMVVTRPEDGLRKSKSVEASFIADEDVPAAAKKGHMQYAHSLPMHRSQMAMKPPMKQGMVHGIVPALSSASSYNSPGAAGLFAMDYNDMLFGLPATQTAYTSTHRPLATRPSPTKPPKKGRKKNKKNKAAKRKGKNRGGRRMKKKKNKKCIRNKRVFLQSVLVHGQQMEDACYELKASRQSMRNYTLFANQAANQAVTVAMERRFLSSVYIQHGDISALVKVHSSGVLSVMPPQSNNSFARFSADMHSLVFRLENVMVTVNITKQTCKVSFLSVGIDIGDNDAPMGKYTGAVAKAFHKSKRSKRRNGKAKKKRVPKGCAGKVPADRAWVLKGKYLTRYAL